MSDPKLLPETEFAVALALTDQLRIGDDTVTTPRGQVRVSTVLHPDKAIDRTVGRPYETAFFVDGEMDDEVYEFYATREEATAGHAAWVAKLRGEDSR